MRALFAIIAIIILYGSLFPFDFQWPKYEQFSFVDWTLSLSQRTTNGDRLSNLLTFVPLSFFGYFYNPFKSQTLSKKIGTVILICFLFAYLLQLTQFFTPRRVPTMGDVFYNLWGAIFGLAIALILESYLKNRPKLSENWFESYSVSSALSLFAILYFLFPFFFQIDLSVFIEGAIPLWTPPWLLPEKIVVLFAYWFMFLTLLKDYFWKSISLAKQSIIVSSILFLKIISAHNFIDLDWVISAVLAVAILHLLTKEWRAKIALLVLTIALLVSTLLPWKIKMLTGEFNWLPLGNYLNGSLWVNTHIFLERIYMFGGILFFAERVFSNWRMAIVYCFGLVMFVELLQLFISSGQANLSEPLIVLVLAFIFAQLKLTRLEKQN